MSHIAVDGITLQDDIDSINLTGARATTELAVFNVKLDKRKFIECTVEALDYLSALKKQEDNFQNI